MTEGVSKSMEPAPKQKITPQQRTASVVNETDLPSDYNDDFEKEDIVKIEEPINAASKIVSKRKPKYAERQTKESSRDAGSENQSLIRDISIRNKLETAKVSSSMPPSNRVVTSKGKDIPYDRSVQKLASSPGKTEDAV